MKTVLVEQNEDLRNELQYTLSLYGMFEIAKTFDNVNEANEYICNNEIDVVFINADIGDYRYSSDGSFLAGNVTMRYPDILVVLYGKEERNASSIFWTRAIDYFVLPLRIPVMERIVSRIRYLSNLLEYKKQSVNRSLMVRTGSGYQMVPVDNILFIERVNRRNRMVMTDGTALFLTGYSLEELGTMLKEYNFYRCYKSFIVNLSKVSSVHVENESKNYSLQLDGYAGGVMLSRDKYAEVLQLLKDKYARISL